MNTFTKLFAASALALGMAATATPAAAQVQGRIATADVSRAIIGTTALQNAYSQIGQTYSAQIEQRNTKQQQLATLLQPFDANGNGQLEESELPAIQSSPNLAQIQTLEQEIAALTNQVNAARAFAVDQILAQYPAALTQVTTQQQIVVVLQHDTIQFATPEADITQQVTAALNTLVPAVQIVPPADWRPGRNTPAIFQEIQQTLIAAQFAQQQQQAQQQPATQAPQGR